MADEKGQIQFSKKALGCETEDEWQALPKDEKDRRFRLAWEKFKRRDYQFDGVDFIEVKL